MTAAQALPVGVKNNPALDAWVRVDPEGTVTLFTGKVEIGQGIKTAIAAIGAEELDLPLERIRVHTADTSSGPNEMYTASSQSVEDSGGAVRAAAAEARQALLERASERWGVPADQLATRGGVIRTLDGRLETTYWELGAGKRFERSISGTAPTKPPSRYEIVGRRQARIDLPDKIFGRPCFVQDLRLPGMLYGRVLRPPTQHATLSDLELGDIPARPGIVKVIRDGSFVAVVAEREYQAVRAVQALAARARWDVPACLPAESGLEAYLRAHADRHLQVLDGAATVVDTLQAQFVPSSPRWLSRSYFRPYLMHGSLGPSAAVAEVSGGGLCVWTQNQGVHVLAAALADLLGMPRERVRVRHIEGAGSYGHNAAEDAACDAALMAAAVAPRPVSVQWSRFDEHAWEPYGPAMAVDLQAELDGDGVVANWSHDVWGSTHLARATPGTTSGFIAAWHLSKPWQRTPTPPWTGAPQLGGHRNAEPLYAFATKRVVEHFAERTPLRTSTLRSLGAYLNVLAIESFMDELAELAGSEPVEFRLRHMADARHRAVLVRLAEEVRWRARDEPGGSGRGRGIAIAQYKNSKAIVGVAVDLVVDEATCGPRLLDACLVVDAGRVIDSDGLRQQIEGGFLQSSSWTLKERVQFDKSGVTSVDWDSYPILRFSDVPPIRTVVIDRPEESAVGAGEAAQGPTAAAIANALARALGTRVRDTPFTAERVRRALLAES